jgi:hypothetical protein
MTTTEPTKPTELLTEADTMAWTRLNDRQLRRARDGGKLPWVRLGIERLYKPEDIEAFIAASYHRKAVS